MVFFLIFSMVLDLDQLQISQLHRAVALDISKAFDRAWHAGLLHKLKSYGISGQIVGLIYSFLGNRRLRVVLDGRIFTRISS